MNKVRHPDQMTRWIISNSHLVTVPAFIDSITLDNLRRRVQEMSDQKQVRSDRPPTGEIEFRYELDNDDCVEVVHCYFQDSRGLRRRFMKLHRS